MIQRNCAQIALNVAFLLLLFCGMPETALYSIAVAAKAAYPTKPIRIIDPFPPGGATDYLDRIIAPKLGERLGQPVIVDNRPGAGGNLSAEIAAQATPDGYTLLMNLPSSMVAGKILSPELIYSVPHDFAYVTLVAAGTYVLVAHPSVPAKSVAELIKLAQSKAAHLRCGSSGVASPPHLALELFKLRTGADILHVPYKGAGPLVTALTGGEVQLGFASVPGVSSLVKAGRLNALAVTSSKRTSSFPSVPTIAESGYPGFDVTPRYGYMVPAATPKSIVHLLNREIGKILDVPEVQNAFLTQGLEATSSTPEAFRGIVDEEVMRWTEVIRRAHIAPH